MSKYDFNQSIYPIDILKFFFLLFCIKRDKKNVEGGIQFTYMENLMKSMLEKVFYVKSIEKLS